MGLTCGRWHIPKSNAVIFFMLFNLIARLGSLENPVAVTHFLVGSVITDSGRKVQEPSITSTGGVASFGFGHAPVVAK